MSDNQENQGKTKEEILDLIRNAMSYKERSHATLNEVHLEELALTESSGIDVVLIGDSMLERFKTTGASTELAKLERSFNAGCGGDKIENVLYRLSFMYPLLENKSIKLWVVMIGTNNLRKKGFRGSDIGLYRLLLQALLNIEPESKILACEIFKRKDIDDVYVDQENRSIREMIAEMNVNLGAGQDRIIWSSVPEKPTIDQLDDHVHLNEEGYRIWDETLYPRVKSYI